MRWTPLLALALFLAIAGVWVTHDRQGEEKWYGAGSSLARGPEGLSLARGYLSAARVSTLASPLDRATLTPDAVLVRLRPEFSPAYQRPVTTRWWEAQDGDARHAKPPRDGMADAGARAEERPVTPGSRPLLSDAEERWVRGGGRLVLGITRPYGPLETEGETAGGSRAPVRKSFPALPGVEQLDPPTDRVLAGKGLLDSVALFTRGAKPLLSQRPLGQGELFLLSAPELLENAQLARADHLALWSALVADPRGERPVVFDEYVHGAEEAVSVVALLHRWGLWPALWLLALTFFLWAWRNAVPLGPPEPFRDTRTESVDLVDALSRLYGRALRPQEALALYRQRLARLLQEKHGLDANAARARLPLPDGDFQRQLTALNEAYRRLHERRLHP